MMPSSRNVRRGLVAALVLLMIPGNGTAEATEASSPATLSPPAKIGQPALWRVRDKDSTVYLFGTVAVLCPQEQWFSGEIQRAFETSGELIIEVDPHKQPETLIASMANPADAKLSDAIGPELNQKLQAFLADHKLPPAAFESARPWIVALSVNVLTMQDSCYRTESGADNRLLAYAKADKKAISYLDTADAQLQLFASLPQERQIEFLRYSLDTAGTLTSETNDMVAAWRSGRPEAIMAMFADMFRAMPWMRELLLIGQNRRWVAKIDERMKGEGTLFVGVTAGHLIGEDSMQQMLSEKGYLVERLQ